ncbi:BREX-3 system phosphatase PglZ [Marinobacter sp.]|jgi:hypothetical protein|uniref:BREX-3 system phosphatase PglZ n=2 Tax=unclassified Marinobacter TaxID=83889 RepID=UPI000C97FC79|nr:BREX-3 system phosphatase PglZ [Marinobacter sp.]MAK49101.1 alkaline phosphatase [Marinobacter sp.]|tara:strand:+ start:2513 stop:4507 length:1995 start_codon:yes stop_codon:yes gene_type:complete
MKAWAKKILHEFPSDLSRLWIASDPDGVLLDEQILSELRKRGFEVLPFEDSIAFRAEYEELYRIPWEQGDAGAAKAVVLHVQNNDLSELPWDYLRSARQVRLGLNELFPHLSYSVVQQVGSELLPDLFEAQAKHAPQPLGEAATKDFVLAHIFRLSPHFITQEEDFWRETLRLHYRDICLPEVLAEYISQVIGDNSSFNGIPVASLMGQKDFALRTVQDSWYRYLHELGITGSRISDGQPSLHIPQVSIPFDHHDIRVIVDSMFLDGTLHPMEVNGVPSELPEWAKAGVIQDPKAMRDLVLDGAKTLSDEMPGSDSSYRDWLHFSRRFGEILSRFHSVDAYQAEGIRREMRAFVQDVDDQLAQWVAKHYADLPSLPIARGPVMLHHVPRYLAMKHNLNQEKIALVVFDGLALDQWVQVRESLVKACDKLMFNELSCFAWLPTLTSVSRQALFSGLRPREFPDDVESTSREPIYWKRFWQDQGARPNDVYFQKSIKRNDDLPALEDKLSNPSVKVAGLVVDTVDEIIHGAVLGKQGVATQIANWCESGFVTRLFRYLLDNGYQVYLTADHGNAEATGIGRINQGVGADLRGERVRTYRNETTLAETAKANPDTVHINVPGLPTDFLPLFAQGRGAFVPEGDQVVVHGGMSLEELIVPFVKVSYVH